MLGKTFLHEKKSIEFVKSKKSATSKWKIKTKYFVIVYFPPLTMVSLNTYKRRKWVAFLLQNCCC